MRFCIIDVSNLVHRAKHSVGKKAPVSNPFDPWGESVEAEDPESVRVGLILTVVFNGLMSAFQKFDADHVVAAFDLRSWRRDFYEDYKANRRDKVRTPAEEADHALINHVIDELRDFLRDYTNVTVLETAGAEADDFIARWVQVHDDPVFQNVIVSADGDFKQLVGPNVELFNPMASTLYTMDGVFHQDGRKKKKDEPLVRRHGESWKIKKDKKGQPETFDPDWELFEKCVRGDSSDNIPSAWPGVRTTKMRKAFDGSVEDWNNFINSTWGGDKTGDKKQSVRKLYERNRTLIDLTAQPENVVENIDEAIADALDMERARMVGAAFAMFCSKYKLNKISGQADRFTHMLTQGYPS